MKIAVSGATGSLGKAVMQHLTDQGHEVLGLGRNEAKIQALEGEGFTMRKCDILDVNAIENCIIGIDVMVHCAAFASPFGSKRKHFETNLQVELRIFSLRQNTALSNVLSPSHPHLYLTVVDPISNTLMTYRTSQCGPNIIMVPVSMMPSYSACLNRI